jgi:hypothetical protein
MASICFARLTRWEKTNEVIGTANARASIPYMCSKPTKDGFLCKDCSVRPVEGKYQSRMIHGFVTDPCTPSSHVYGSDWYWEKVAIYGDPPSSWIEAAQQAQTRIEEKVQMLGAIPWKVQRPCTKMLEEMVVERKQKNSMVAKKRQETVLHPQNISHSNQTKLLFPEILTWYEESEEPPIVAKAFSSTLQKVLWKGKEVFRSESGRLYSINAMGKPGNLIT